MLIKTSRVALAGQFLVAIAFATVYVSADVGTFIRSRVFEPFISAAFDIAPPASLVAIGSYCGISYSQGGCYGPNNYWNPSCYSSTGGCQILGAPTSHSVTNYLILSSSVSDFNKVTYPLGRRNPALSVRTVFQLPSVIINNKTLFEIAFNTPDLDDPSASYSLKVTIGGSGQKNGTGENALLTRVFNAGFSCVDMVGNSTCNGDLLGFLKPKIFYDLTWSFDSYGWLSIYQNSTLITRAYGYRLPANVQSLSMLIGDDMQSSPTMEVVNLRLLDVYNISLSAKHIKDIGDSFFTMQDLASVYRSSRRSPNDYYQSESIVDSLYASSLYIPPVDVPLIPLSYKVDFNDLQVLTPDLRYNNQTAYAMGGAYYVMDVLNTPNVNGLLIPSSNAFAVLTDYLGGIVMGGASTFTLSYKYDPAQKFYSNMSTILFSCASLNSNNMQVDRIALYANSANMVTFSITRGLSLVYTLTGNLSNPLAQPPHALGVYDISVVVNIDGSVFMYNHGFLVASGSNMGLPYVSIRQCFLGRDAPTNNVTLASPSNLASFIGAFLSFTYRPYAVSMATISQSLLPNATVSVPFDGRSLEVEQTFSTPYFVADINILSCILRNGAFYQPNTTSLIPVPIVSHQVTSYFESGDFSSSSSGSDPSVSALSSSMSEDEVPPVLNTFEGSMVLVNGGYLNLGPMFISGAQFGMTFRLRFQLLRPITEHAPIFSSHNRLPGAPAALDSFVIRTGAQRNYSVDLVIEVTVNGASCNTSSSACTLTVPGALHVNRFTDLMVIFNSGNTFVFIDSCQVATSTTLWAPPAVVRPYNFIGYGGYTTSSTRKPSQNMQVYSYSLIAKPLLLVDIHSMSPPLTQSYTYRFLTEASTPHSSANVSTLVAAAAGSDTAAFAPTLTSAVTPVIFYGNASWVSDPFHRVALGLPTDSTSPDLAATQNTPGVYLNNMNRSSTTTALTSVQSGNTILSDNLKNCNRLVASLTQLQQDLTGAIVNYNSVLQVKAITTAPPTTTAPPPSTTSAPTSPGQTTVPPSTLPPTTTPAPTQDPAIVAMATIVGLINNNADGQGLLGLATPSTLSQLQSTLAGWISNNQSLCDGYSSQLAQSSDTSVLEALNGGAGVGSFISLGGMYLSSSGSFRIKFRIGQDIPYNVSMPIVDISNGAAADGFIITQTGRLNATLLTISVYRGDSLYESIVAGPLDSSRYWIDLFVVFDSFGNVKIYNWGQLINYGVMWVPIPGFRQFALLGASSDPASPTPYMVNGAFQLFQYIPEVQSSRDIASLYTEDQPPLVVPSLVGPIYTMNASFATSFVWRPPNDVPVPCSQCKKYNNFGDNCNQFCQSFNGDCNGYVNLTANPSNAHVSNSLLQHVCAVRDDAAHPHLYAFPPTDFSNDKLLLALKSSNAILSPQDSVYQEYWNFDYNFCDFHQAIPFTISTTTSGMDCVGNDIAAIDTNVLSDCTSRCSSTPGCVAVVATIPLTRCWIKTSCNNPTPNAQRNMYKAAWQPLPSGFNNWCSYFPAPADNPSTYNGAGVKPDYLTSELSGFIHGIGSMIGSALGAIGGNAAAADTTTTAGTWPQLNTTGWNPYFDYSSYIAKLTDPSNFFTDKAFADVPGAVISDIVFYQPQLLVFKNRAQSTSHTSKSSDFSKPFIYEMNVVDSLLLGQNTGSTWSDNLTPLNGGGFQVNGDSVWSTLADIGDILFLNPPKIAFQYTAPGYPNPVPPVQTRASNIFQSTNSYDPFNAYRFVSDLTGKGSVTSSSGLATVAPTTPPGPTTTSIPFENNNAGFAFGDNKIDVPASTPSGVSKSNSLFSYTLQKNEYITQIDMKCNLRFAFKTSLGNEYVVGDSNFVNRMTSCFSGITATTTDSNGKTTTTLKAQTGVDVITTESYPGYSLAYMSGSKGGMFSYQFHWLETPISYEMFNMVFDFDASTSLTGKTPSQAISLDMYNHSPLDQTNWMTHSVSVTNEHSISVTDTMDNSWNEGWHSEGHVDVTPMGVGGGASFGWHKDHMTTESNRADTKGGSNSTTTDDTQMLMANVPAHSKVTANLLVFNGFVDIPFTADVLITYAGGHSEHVITHGIYNNVATTAIIVTYSDAKPIDKPAAGLSSSSSQGAQPGGVAGGAKALGYT